jgi:NADH-quinone oxidoreductase subunit M
MLTSIVLLPLLAALLIAMIPPHIRFGIRLIALLATFLTLLLATLLFWRFETGAVGYQFVSRIPGLGSESLGMTCRFGVDGVNIGLILMAALVAFAATCVSWEIKSREKEFYILLLIMAGGILGAFASLDLFFLYFFHELALVPTFIMIGVWGRGEQKNYATFQITLYLSLGALLALVGLIALYLQVPPDLRTADAVGFDIAKMTEYFKTHPVASSSQQFVFPLLLFGFGILVSLWPFHTWAPLGYSCAPTATTMLHAGVLKKFGLYGLIRIALPLLPESAKSWLYVLALLCLGNIIHCGWVAMRQRDLNLLLGNSSVAHMGFAFLGIASLTLVGVTGAVLVMIAHGLLAALSFGLSGYLYQQTKTLEMEKLGGLLQRLPFIGTALVMALFAGCGLPGFANFVGELLVLFGAWKGPVLASPGSAFNGFVVTAAWGGLLIGAIYMLRAIRRILHGELPEKWEAVTDASLWRKVPFALLLAALLVFGCFPSLLTEKIKPSAEEIVKMATSPKPSGNRTVAQTK